MLGEHLSMLKELNLVGEMVGATIMGLPHSQGKVSYSR